MRNIYLFITIIGLNIGCQSKSSDIKGLTLMAKEQQVSANIKLTKVIVEDIFTPPVASRIYAYANIAYYEAIAQGNDKQGSLASLLNKMPEIIPSSNGSDYSKDISAMIAFTSTAKALVFDADQMQTQEDNYLKYLERFNLRKDYLNNSIIYGKKVAAQILKWTQSDGYLERTAMSAYALSKEPGTWQPTPPDYMPAIEPNWNTLRPFILKDKIERYRPIPETPFSSSISSQFYKEAIEVYNTVNQLSEEQEAIAQFWDCNPNVSHTKGHMMYFDQKISPGGHWISIAGITTTSLDYSAAEKAKVFAWTALGIADAFISCWDEKYRSELIRPETYIAEYIDDKWKPLLQTPPFPEYTSGHSVISATAAQILTHIVGDKIPFRDSTEVKYGLPERNFTSFNQAADEAAISRLYGGIHYMPAITNGVEQGKKLALEIIPMIPN